MKHSIKIIIYAMMIIFFTGITSVSANPETAATIQSETPGIEVMFVLDTTGSMGGLIAAAKEKVWSIANTLSSADPAPDIKMGLVGYRDRGDQYVTVVTPLTDDLDAVYSDLMTFSASGGGDGPESVNQALYEAVTKAGWSHQETVYRVVFLVGDAPPHMDYQDDVKYAKTCKMASEKNIIINTIQCGTMAGTTPVWKEVARLAHGEFFRVAQSGSAVMYDTPYDKEMAKISRELDDTRIFYGSADYKGEMEEKKQMADRLYDTAAPSAVAKRAVFNASKSGQKNFLGAQELVRDIESKNVKLSDIDKDELPEPLQKMNPAELENHVKQQSEKRSQLQVKLDDLTKKRQSFIEAEVKQESGLKENSLDGKIYNCIQSQAAGKDIIYKGGPAY